jgi:hypothetical protein
MKRFKRKIKVIKYKQIKGVKEYVGLYDREDLPHLIRYTLILLFYILVIGIIYYKVMIEIFGTSWF